MLLTVGTGGCSTQTHRCPSNTHLECTLVAPLPHIKESAKLLCLDSFSCAPQTKPTLTKAVTIHVSTRTLPAAKPSCALSTHTHANTVDLHVLILNRICRVMPQKWALQLTTERGMISPPNKRNWSLIADGGSKDQKDTNNIILRVPKLNYTVHCTCAGILRYMHMCT